MITLSVPAVLDYRDLVTRAVATVCKVVSASLKRDAAAANELSNAMVSAVGEAFNNVVEHAYHGHGGGTARIVIERDGDVLRVVMSDDGRSFDIDAVPDPDLPALPESGMGLFIIRAFVDEVSYCAGPPNVLTLTKKLTLIPP